MGKPAVYLDCAQCGTSFKRRKSSQRFCDKTCFAKSITYGKPSATCESCGIEFIGRLGKPNRFCSKSCSNDGKYLPLEEKLWRGVVKSLDPDGCWERTGPRGYREPEGYTNIYHDGKKEGAHRISYRLYVGPIGDEDLACHKCDNPPCIRPDHLFKGGYLENNRDMATKGRSIRGRRRDPAVVIRGEHVHGSKLTPDIVREIRRLHDEGMTQVALAVMFEVRQTTISCIVRRTTWQHVA